MSTMCEMTFGDEVGTWTCSCTAGRGKCNHEIALLYQLGHYQNLGLKRVPPVVSKTSRPQDFHVPRTQGITPSPLSDLMVVKPETPGKKTTKKKKKTITGIVSTLYNPVKEPLPDAAWGLVENLRQYLAGQEAQIFQLLPAVRPTLLADSKPGQVFYHSTLAHQQALPSPEGFIVAEDTPDRPACPRPILVDTYDGAAITAEMQAFLEDRVYVTTDESDDYEVTTRIQSQSEEWRKLRQVRLTASKFKQVCSRQADFSSLAERLHSGKVVRTPAMQRGIDLEDEASTSYAYCRGVSIFKIGLVINPSAPHLGCSPDRLVYDPTEEEHKWGLLEIKCPDKDWYRECKFLKTTKNGDYTLKKVHEFYYQVTGQMGITGFQWCDFYVYCREDYFLQRVYFDDEFFQDMKAKLDNFYFQHLLPLLVSATP